MRRYALLVGLVIVFLLIVWAGAGKTLRLISKANPIYLSLAILVFWGCLVAWTERWKLLLEELGINVSRIEVFKAVLMGIFMNNITPGARGGGEPLRGYYIAKKSGKPYGPTFATIAADRVLDLIPIFTMLVISTAYSYHAGNKRLALAIIVLTSFLLLITILAVLVLTSEKKTVGIIRRISKLVAQLTGKKGLEEKIISKTRESFKSFVEGFKVLIRQKTLFLKALLLSYLFWCGSVMRTYFVFLSLGEKIELGKIMVVQVVGTVVGVLSLLPGGTGIVETVTSGAYVLLGISRETAVAAILLDRLIYYWFPTLMGGMITSESVANIRKKI